MMNKINCARKSKVMAKDFTRSYTPRAASAPSQVNSTAGDPRQTQQVAARRNWQPQNLLQQPNQQDREAEIIEALKNPEFVQKIAQVLKDRNEALETEEFLRHALQQIQARDLEAHEKLVQCTPASVQAAVKKLAVMGLSPNAEAGEAWLLPRWNNKASVYTAIAVPGVRGMERKLMETGNVANIESRAIYLQDHCRVKLGTENVIAHEVNFCPDPERPNPIVGLYGVVTLKDGRREIAVKRLYQAPKPPGQQEQEKEKSRSYMDEETNARYLAQRPAMRGALNKFFKEDRALQALVEMENESYESAMNRGETGDVKVKVDSNGLAIPLAQVGAAPPSDSAVKQSLERKTSSQTEPGHPVDQMVDKIRQQYEEGTHEDAERGVRV
jgi:recombination protein RecT